VKTACVLIVSALIVCGGLAVIGALLTMSEALKAI
jgi:hypothetical protein